jgi:hypothetical protein
MAYRQYTKCVQPNDYSNFGLNTVGILNMIGMALTFGLTAWIVAAIASGPVGLAVAIAEVIAVIALLRWWLNGRLICLGKEPCLIGMVGKLTSPDPVGNLGDNDFDMDVLLAPGPTGFRDDFANANLPKPPVSDYQAAPQGDLLSPQSSISAIFKGYEAESGNAGELTALHCEFEGSGIRDLLIFFEIVLALLVAALVLESIPGWGWLATILIILAILVGGGGILMGALNDLGPGSPTDVSPDLKELAEGDIVVVRGVWIYDSFHEGWNEIHPIKDCHIALAAKDSGMTKLSPWPPGFATAAEVKAQLELWCPMIQDAHDAEDGGSRDDPKNDWTLHPLVDGCSDVVIA